MLRMEFALLVIMSFVAFIYFTAGRHETALHKTFAVLLNTVVLHLFFDTITVYTVNHLDSVSAVLNAAVHRVFIGSMVLVVFLFYQYIAILIEEETGKARQLDRVAGVFLVLAELGILVLPIHYAITEHGNYSDGIHVLVCYASIVFYIALCVCLLAANWTGIEDKKRRVIAVALTIEISICLVQNFNPTWLISGLGISLVTLSFYLTLENPDILRAELVEQKMSMLYLKSQVNPHFLYNTLGSIRIEAELNGDKKVADLLMNLVEFFRMSIKIDQSFVDLDDELAMVDAYMELMCYRYPGITYDCDVDPDLGIEQIPNFILQPIVENAMLHGLKNVGYKGRVAISGRKVSDSAFEICVTDTGCGFSDDTKKRVDNMLRTYKQQAPKLKGNSIGILNVQKRIKLQCGREYGLSYTQNEESGVTAQLLLPAGREG